MVTMRRFFRGGAR